MSSADVCPYRPSPIRGPEVFAFPHVGAGAAAFAATRQHMQEYGIALSAMVRAGRERRVRQPVQRSVAEVVREAVDYLTADPGLPERFALLGHSAGALVAYECAVQLEQAGHAAEVLVVCCCAAPELVVDTGYSSLPSDELQQLTVAKGGTSPELAADPAVWAMMERALRADWEIYDTYRDSRSVLQRTPIMAVGGRNDAEVAPQELDLWSTRTRAGFVRHELTCGHWVPRDQPAELAQLIAARLVAR